MTKIVLWKVALFATIAIFCALIGTNAYLASKNLNIIQRNAAQRLAASDVQSNIVAVRLDLKNLQTGQQSYLLTGDASSLAPYTAAVQQLPSDLIALRSHLAGKDRALESDLEALTNGKISEAQETIALRQKGYRHRAFLIVDSGRGKDMMDKAESLLSTLASTESAAVSQYQQQFSSSVSTAQAQVVMANLLLLALTILTLLAFHYRSHRLRTAYDEQAKSLRATTGQLERLTSTLSSSVLSTIRDMQAQSEYLLNVHGGFLPRQGQEGTEWLYNASRHVHGVINSLLQPSSSNALERASEEVIETREPVEFPETTELPKSHTA